MAEISVDTKKKLILVSGRAHPELATQVASELGIELTGSDLRTFANGEIYARYDTSIRGADVFVLQSHTAPINEWVMETLIMIDALKRASAKRITEPASSASADNWRHTVQSGRLISSSTPPPGGKPLNWPLRSKSA